MTDPHYVEPAVRLDGDSRDCMAQNLGCAFDRKLLVPAQRNPELDAQRGVERLE